MPQASDIPGTQFYPSGGTTDRDRNYGALHATDQFSTAGKIGVNQWLDSGSKTVWVDVFPSTRVLRDDYVKAGWSVRLFNPVAQAATTPNTVQLPAGTPPWAVSLFSSVAGLATDVQGITQSSNAAANSAQATQQAVSKAAAPSTDNTLLYVLLGGLAAFLLLKK